MSPLSGEISQIIDSSRMVKHILQRQGDLPKVFFNAAERKAGYLSVPDDIDQITHGDI